MAIHGRHGESPLPVVARVHAGPVLRGRVRGGADRRPLPDAGDPAVRPVPGQLERAVADPRRRPLPAIDPHFAEATASRSSPTRATRTLRAPVGDPGHARPRAPDRRAGEARRDGRHLLRRRQPRADDASSARPRCTASRCPPLEVDPTRRRAAGARLGLEPRRDPRRRAPRPPQTATRSRSRTCATCTRCRRTSARCCTRFDRVLVPEMNSGQLAQILRAGTWSTSSLHQGRRASRCSPARDRGAMMLAADVTTLTKADFQSDQETRWCPGCGDYAVLSAVQQLHARARDPAGADRVRHRHRLRRPLRLLHGHLRDARHPRPRDRRWPPAWRRPATTCRSGS